MESNLRPSHHVVVDKFIKACQADDRIVAAVLVGSYVKGKPDEHSDLDLYLITTEEGYFKIENAVPVQQLSSLKDTFAPLEQSAMLKAAFDIIRFYKNWSRSWHRRIAFLTRNGLKKSWLLGWRVYPQ